MSAHSVPARQELLRVEVASDAELRALIDDAPAPGVRASAAVRCALHDIWYDTPAGLLEQAGVACRIRTAMDGARRLMVERHAPTAGISGAADSVCEAPVLAHGEDWRSEESPPRAALCSLIDPVELVPVLEITTERYVRRAPAGFLRQAAAECELDTVTVRVEGSVRSFREAAVWQLGERDAAGLAIAAHWGSRFRAVPSGSTQGGRARLLAETMKCEAAAVKLRVGVFTALILVRDGRIACRRDGGRLRLPTEEGCGARIAEALAGQLGGSLHGLTRAGMLPPTPDRGLVEVWLTQAASTVAGDRSPADAWVPLTDLLERAGGPFITDANTLAALAVLIESPAADDLLATASALPPALLGAPPAEPQTLDAELSLIDFNARVLTMAEDRHAAIGDRLRMLAITCANIDEFVMVRLAELKEGASRRQPTPSHETLGATARFDAARVRLGALAHRQARCLAACLEHLAAAGVRCRSWSDLAQADRDVLRAWFTAEVAPRIMTGGMTLILGHAFPRLPSLTLSFCTAGRSRTTNEWGLGQFDLPRDTARFLSIPGTTDVIPVEEVARACADVLYPHLDVVATFTFRVLREGDLTLSEQGDLFVRVEEGTRRRGFNHIVRLEVERAMPASVRQAILATFQVEPGIAHNALTVADLHVAPGLVAMGDVRELVNRAPARPPERSEDPRTVQPLSELWDELRGGDQLLHHPYVAYDATVLRFLAAAAADPQVRGIWITLYRVGDPSPVVDALLVAQAAGKLVEAYVELTARFDESRNLSWVRRLEEGGVRVAYGGGELKCHAKTALVERQEDGALRRYAHVGTGNYNALSARMYTDFSLLTADPRITADLRRFFDWLLSNRRAPLHCEHCLVAPANLLQPLLARIEREIAHARAGRQARIRLKLNALSEDELVQALYRASRAGVEIDLVVRGICTLRPGVPGLSERIRVASRIGRFLEHGRIYHFANGGDDEYLIGSADWRPRNMRRRVEVAVPVLDAAARLRLTRILDAELADPARWRLESDGRTVAPAQIGAPTADERFAASS